MTIKLIGLSGSLRVASFNTQLLRNVARLLPDDATLTIGRLEGIPLFNQDHETPQPAAVVELKEAISACDGLVVCTPEYNLGIPGVLKNTFDWLSRPPQDQPRALHGRPVLLMGACNGPVLRNSDQGPSDSAASASCTRAPRRILNIA